MIVITIETSANNQMAKGAVLSDLVRIKIADIVIISASMPIPAHIIVNKSR
jgi:hypothetical protein